MVLVPLRNELKVTLEDPKKSSSGHKTIRVTCGGGDNLDISLRRTVRVPDNGDAYDLPPDCGPFPIYSVKDYKSQLPKHMAVKGEREAMWINFESKRPFAIKIYAGGINAVSGEPKTEDLATMLRRKMSLSEGKSIQDYVVAGSQLWLDGIATMDGKVIQFVATPVGSGYSVEAQIKGNDSTAGLQFEIIPTKRKPMCIYVISLTGKRITLEVETDMTIADIKYLVDDQTGLPYFDQRLIACGKQLKDDLTLYDYNITDGDILHLALRLRGGGYGLDPEEAALIKKAEIMSEMAVAPGGFINQTIVRDPVPAMEWDTENTILFNLQLLNASSFEQLLGIKAPPTPITLALYKRYGYPFFKLYEEKSGIKDNFPGVKSVAQLDRKRRVKRTYDDQQVLRFPVVELNTIVRKIPFIPVSMLEAALKELHIAEEI